jgi:hypothetical protein
VWKASALLLLGCVSLQAAGGAGPAAPVSASSSAADFANAAKLSLCGELSVLDGGPLSQALVQAAQRGVHLRLILDSSDRGTRLQGRALQRLAVAMSPTAASAVELRWRHGAGRSQRRLQADDARLLRWTLGEEPRRDDAGAAAFRRGFEKRWPLAVASLPEAQALDDDLKALPDPRESDPRIVRRRDAAGE